MKMKAGIVSGAKMLAKSALPPSLLDGVRLTVRWIKNLRSPTSVFTQIYRDNKWGDPDSASGPGSNLESTASVRAALPDLIRRYGIQSVLDVPCGDLFWVTHAIPKGVTYTGGDIVPEIIANNHQRHPKFGKFIVIDLVTDPLPAADLVLVRDCLIHLPLIMAAKAIQNIKASGAKYLLSTTCVNVAKNLDIAIGGYRPVNLSIAPFNLPQPIELIAESDDPRHEDGRSLGLWSLDQI